MYYVSLILHTLIVEIRYSNYSSIYWIKQQLIKQDMVMDMKDNRIKIHETCILKQLNTIQP